MPLVGYKPTILGFEKEMIIRASERAATMVGRVTFLIISLSKYNSRTSTSNIEILEHFQSKALRMTVGAPWYVPNTVIRRDLQIPTVKEEIRSYSSQYSARLSALQMT
jgi:hypothetical protein